MVGLLTSRARTFVLFGSSAWAAAVVLAFATQAQAQDDLTSVESGSAVPTFESIGVVVPFSGDDDRDATARVEFRKRGAEDWRTGLDLWADHRTQRRDSREFRGSLVHLEPGTEYEIKVTYSDPDGGSGTVELSATTWSESFPEGEVVEVGDRTTPLEITEGGTTDAYRVYQSPPGETSTIDVGDNHDHNVVISADHVIVRGLKLTGAKTNAVSIGYGAQDIVIENSEITNWGPSGIGSLDGWSYTKASGIYAREETKRLVIQNNRIHDPRGGANSWKKGPEPWQDGQHPQGPQAVSLDLSRGQNVIRHNEMYSEGARHFYLDVIGGKPNRGRGNLYRNSDVYGNLISHARDDGIEVEGYNINVRIWGNVIWKTMKAVATANAGYVTGTPNGLGPQYIWRNLIMDAGPPSPSATKIRGIAGYYFLHNTIIDAGKVLAAPREDSNTDVSKLQQVGVVKNNLMLTESFYRGKHKDDVQRAAPYWTVDYNLYPVSRSKTQVFDDWEQHGIFGKRPQFDVEGDHTYYLADGAPGVDAAERLPNFNDKYSGEGPDIGAFERGAFPRESETCQDGETRSCDTGACEGMQTCTEGSWSKCDGAEPGDEMCGNGVDDDCDGKPDGEDPDCAPVDLTSHRVEGPVEIDGKLGEYGQEDSLEFSAGGDGDNSVEARSVWSDEGLSFGFQIADADIEVEPKERDEAVHKNDGVELFLDVDHDAGSRLGTDDYHLIVDAEGAIWDGRGTGEADNFGDSDWNSSMEVATRTNDSAYTVELRIPWSDLNGDLGDGARLGMLVVNNDRDEQLSYYSQQGGPPWNVPDAWGDLMLVEGPGSNGDGTDAGTDAESVSGSETDAGGAPRGDPGCGCGTAGSLGGLGTGWWLAILVLLGGRMRRNRRRCIRG